MSSLLAEHAGLIRQRAAAAEQRGELHPDVLELVYREKWFRLMAPKRFGGLALPLPAVVRLEEELASADGSVGWTVTLCAGAGWFAGFFGASAGLDKLFSDPRMCIAGSGASDGVAERLADGGYRVNGRWAYASGARHATAFTANCVIWADGAPVLEANGQPKVRPFLFLRREVEVSTDWKAMGLVATGSHGFSVTDLELPAERVFAIDAEAAVDDSPLYRYPFLPLAQATLAVNSSGMAGHFLDCFEQLFTARVARGHLGAEAGAGVREDLWRARQELMGCREDFYAALDASWAQGVGYDEVSRSSFELAAVSRRLVDMLYPLAGLSAARVDSEINRVWRDLHTASQHPLLVFGR